jgi:ABC-type branched-subunit amino acid transport system ATPase component/ABC-type branched-subunit amino acid transport system permease subunit
MVIQARRAVRVPAWATRSARGLSSIPGLRPAARNPWVHVLLIAALCSTITLTSGIASYDVFVTSIILIYVISAYGLNVSAGLLGQLNLGQGAVFALGAYTTGVLVTEDKLPLIAAVPLSAVAGAILGIIMAVPGSRFGNIGVAMMSLGYTLILQDFITSGNRLTGNGTGLVGIAGPLVSGSAAGPSAIFILTLVCACLAYIGYYYLRTSHIGRCCLAVRTDEIGAAAQGIPSYWLRVLGFSIGSAVGALAGSLYALTTAVVSPGAFGIQLSVLFLLMVILGGAGTRLGPMLGALVIGLLPFALASHPSLNNYIYGALLLLVARVLPRGVFSRTAAPVRKMHRKRSLPPGAERSAEARDVADSADLINARAVTRSFGGIKAVADINLTVASDEVVGLVGLNGSGKTTMANLISGFYSIDEGEIYLNGQRVDQFRSYQRAMLGISRTFQVPKLFLDLSVAEHFELARRQAVAATGGSLEHAALEFLRSVGIESQSPKEVRSLSHGQRRFLEIAMAVVRRPAVVILDEPAAGLGSDEIDRVISLVEELRSRSIGVIIIEHHLDMIQQICDRVAVMHRGRMLWFGPTNALRDSPAVREAYLGVGIQ